MSFVLAEIPELEPSEAQRIYEEYGHGCSCQHPNGRPPCSFCVSLTEEEADAVSAYGMTGLRNLWAGLAPSYVRPMPPPLPAPERAATPAQIAARRARQIKVLRAILTDNSGACESERAQARALLGEP